MNRTTRSLTRAALIAALYVLLTYFLQGHQLPGHAIPRFRSADADAHSLCRSRAGAGRRLFPGQPAGRGGVVRRGVRRAGHAGGRRFLTRKLRKNIYLAALMPTIFNGLIVGPIVYFEFIHVPGTAVNTGLLLANMGSVALGEVVVCYVLGIPLILALKKLAASCFLKLFEPFPKQIPALIRGQVRAGKFYFRAALR